MKLVSNASQQAVGAFLMLGYGERSFPCRQRPVAISGSNSRALASQALPEVIARPVDVFRVWGLGLTWRLIQVQKSQNGVRVYCNTRTLSRTRDFYFYLKMLVKRIVIGFEGFLVC